MIKEYYRPKTLQEALLLLSREDKVTVPLGGGTILSRFNEGQVEVVDLQLLNLNSIGKKCEKLNIGATTTLQQLMDYTELPGAIKTSLFIESAHHLRQMGTVGGTLISATGDSVFGAMILALNAEFTWEPRKQLIRYEAWVKEPKSWSEGKILTNISFPFESKIQYQSISLTPKSKPLLYLVKSIEGLKARYVLGGKCEEFNLFLQDKNSKIENINKFIADAYSGFDQRAISWDYFQSSVAVLFERLDSK